MEREPTAIQTEMFSKASSAKDTNMEEEPFQEQMEDFK